MNNTETFEFFGLQHKVAIAICVLSFLWIIFYGKNISIKIKKIISWTIIFGLLGNELLYNIRDILGNKWNIQTSLSLHLCGFSVFMVSYTLWKKSESTFSLCYFWSIGALQSIVTPNFTETFPSFRFVQFFTSHALIVFGVLFLMITEKFRPTWKSLFNTLIITLILVALVGLFNYTFNANYMFLCEKPIGANITAFMSDSFYLLSLIFVGIFFMVLFYLPYAIYDFVKRLKPTV